ncbi:MAG: L,D-transpeptidase family protein [Bacteroidetes bacterium]|nr:L,D-transpeptidase family protein [Bacteroidota bacterium]
MLKFLYNILLIAVCVLIFSCRENHNNETKVVEVKKPQNVNEEALKLLKDFYSNSVGDSLLVVNHDTLITFSFFKDVSGGHQLLFSDKGKLSPLGDSLLFIIQRARHFGLIPVDYHAYKIASLVGEFFNKKDSAYNVSAVAEAEVLFTDAVLKFGAHLNKGRMNPDTLVMEWNPRKLDTNWTKILKYGIETKNIRQAFDSLEPIHEGYHFLKQAMANYISENESVNWDSISFKNVIDTLKLKEALKQRLLNTGDYNDSLNVNDSVKLAKALKSFQKKMNLDPDGKLGKYTKQALGLNKETTIRQMEMALERWRWEPKKYPERFAIVNIPSAEINVWEWDKKHKIDTLVLNSRVVVGKPENQTPVLRSKINYMLIYPYWNVPYSIAWKEILPMVKRDTNYLHKKNFEVINSKGEVVTDLSKLNWKRYSKDYLPVKFRQRIGEENSLGICKFNFNNKYGVYLHDTNSKKYFKTFYRWQSHGCIRLERFVEMARFLIRDDTLKLPYDTLNAYFVRQQQEKINLRKPLPIYVRYFTAAADSEMNLKVYLDIYRKDEHMMQLLYARNSRLAAMARKK